MINFNSKVVFDKSYDRYIPIIKYSSEKYNSLGLYYQIRPNTRGGSYFTIIVEQLRGGSQTLIEPICPQVLTFLSTRIKYCNFIPNVFSGDAGHVIYVVATFAPAISVTQDWMSSSEMRLICPFSMLVPHI